MNRKIHLKRKIECFYENEEDGLIFALYEDIEGQIHYRHCNYDTDKYTMCSCEFYKTFTRSGERGESSEEAESIQRHRWD